MDYFLLLLTVLFWSGNFVMGRWIYPEVPPVTLAFLRWTLALVILLPFTFREVYRQRDVIRQNMKMLALLALLSVTNFNIFLYMSLNTSPVANAALINSTTPIFIVILLHLLFGRRISLLQGIGIVLSLSGLTFIVLRGDLAVLGTLRFAQGDLWTLAATLSWALYSVLLRSYPIALAPFSFLTVLIIFGVAFIFPVLLGEVAGGTRAKFTPGTVGGICYLAVFPSILSYLFWNRGIRMVGATPGRASLFISSRCSASSWRPSSLENTS